MPMDPPASGSGSGDEHKPYPVPPPLEPDPEPSAASPRRSAAELLPPADTAERRIRRDERADTGRRGRRGGHRGRRSWPQRIMLSVLAVSVVASVSAASLVAYGLYKIEQIQRVDVALSQAPPGDPRNFLLVGSDTRETLEGSGLDEAGFTGDGAEGPGQRSDTIMVVRVDPAAESVDVLSFPRDLWLPIAGTGGSQRINTAYAGGPQRLVDTIELNFDIPIHHYVEVDFAGFAGLVAAIDGVPMWFDSPMRDTHSGLSIDSEGCHVLDPQMALAFARSRNLEYRTDDGWSVDGSGDLGRITRQQVFLRRSLDRVSQLGVGDAVTLNRLADVGIDNVTLDAGVGLDDLLEMGRRFGTFEGDALRTYALPVYPYRTSGGASVLGLEEAQAQPTLNLFRGLPADALAPAQVQDVTVLNGTGEDGHAGLVADALEEVGFGVDEVADADDIPLARSRIRHAPGADAAADLLERHLSAGADLRVDPTLDEGELVLEIGTDFTTVGRRAEPPSERPSTTTTWPSTTSTSDDATGDGDSSTSSSSTAPSTTTTTEPVGVAPDPGAGCV